MTKLTPSFGDPWGEMLVALGGPARHEVSAWAAAKASRAAKAKEKQRAGQARYRATQRAAKLAAAEVPKLTRSAAQQARRDRDRIAQAAQAARVKAWAKALKPANKPQLMIGTRRRG